MFFYLPREITVGCDMHDVRQKRFFMPPPKIVPSLLSADFRKLGEMVRKVERAGADMIHFDIMDGHFVPNISFGPMVVKALRGEVRTPFLVHLMVERPELILEQVVDAGADYVVFHLEASTHPLRILDTVREMGVKAGIALNPATPLAAAEYVLDYVDIVLLMTVNPGFGGQRFIARMFDKIKAMRQMLVEMGLNLDVAVDGGVDLENAGKIVESGANVLIAGSSIFNSADIEETTRMFKKVALQVYERLMKSQHADAFLGD